MIYMGKNPTVGKRLPIYPKCPLISCCANSEYIFIFSYKIVKYIIYIKQWEQPRKGRFTAIQFLNHNSEIKEKNLFLGHLYFTNQPRIK